MNDSPSLVSRIEAVTSSGDLGSVIRLKQFTEVKIWHQEIKQRNSEVH